MIPGFDDTLKGARPAAPPASGQPSTGAIQFPGITKPKSDFEAVRDGRRSGLLSYLVDLTSARSFAAGTALLIPIQGNVFMSDPLFDLAGNAQAGIARVHFQDESINPVGTYVTVLPSAIYKVPFTQIAIENYAQPGKFLYIVYGVDVDLQPGASQQVQASIINFAQQAINGVQSLVVTQRHGGYSATYKSTTNMAALTPDTIFSPGSNVNGALITRAQMVSVLAAQNRCALIAHTSAPANMTTGDILAIALSDGAAAAPMAEIQDYEIDPGKGLYAISEGLETIAYRHCEYRLL